MNKNSNFTAVTEFFLLGFPGVSPEYYPAVGILLLLIYFILAGGNIFTIAFVVYEKNLQKPAYLIFCNLAMVDFAFGTVTMPKIIAKYLLRDDTISFYACFIQMFFIHYLGTVTSFLLLVMAVDRFIAICNPFRYHTLVTSQSVTVTCVIFWMIPGFWMTLIVIQNISVSYCNANIIMHCFCDRNSIIKLSCSDITVPQLYGFIGAMVALLGPLAFIMFSYVSIIVAVLKISNAQGKYKTFSTCSPQLLIICLYYVPRCVVYVLDLNVQMKVDARIMIVMWYSLFPPLVNPIIFCFRTKEIREILLMKLNKRNISAKKTASSGREL